MRENNLVIFSTVFIATDGECNVCVYKGYFMSILNIPVPSFIGVPIIIHSLTPEMSSV